MIRRLSLLLLVVAMFAMWVAPAAACPDRDSCGFTHAGHFAATDPDNVTTVDTDEGDTSKCLREI